MNVNQSDWSAKNQIFYRSEDHSFLSQNTKGSSTVSKNLKKRKVLKRVVSSESRSRSPSPEHRRPLTKSHLDSSLPHKNKGKGKGKETKDRKPKI